MKRLTRDQILAYHKDLIDRHGGTHGLRDEGLFESALAAPYHGFADEEPYPTIHAKAARLGYGLIKNHPFIDGNKRIGAHAITTTLEFNGITANYTEEELERTILEVASGTMSSEDLL